MGNFDRSVEEILGAVSEIAFVERAMAHVLAGWIAKTPSLEDKLEMARQFGAGMTSVMALTRYVDAYAVGAAPAASISSNLSPALELVDRSDSIEQLFARLSFVREAELDLVGELLGVLDRVLEAPVVEHLETLRTNCQSAKRWLLTRDRADERADELAFAWAARRHGAKVPFEGALWRPIDRVETPARDEDVYVATPGQLRPLPARPYSDQADIALVLHNNIDGEYTTLELMARSSYEHPDMPLAFHEGMGRHVGDEVRHARAFEQELERRGGRYGEGPCFTTTYDLLYSFPNVPPGSRLELAWRLLLRSTVDEASSLEYLPHETKVRSHLGQHSLARLFGATGSDEFFHVQNGLKWSRFLCGGAEATAEQRDLANAYYETALRERRKGFIIEHPEIAIEEAQKRKAATETKDPADVPFEKRLNVAARRRAGFTDAEIEQVVAWGHVDR